MLRLDMRTGEDIEAYLMRSGLRYDEVAPNTWLVRAEQENIVVRLDGDIVLFRVKALDLANVTKRRNELFATLLELNATEMLDGAWGVADGAVVLTAVMRLENLDYNEFQGVIDDFGLALGKHYAKLASFRDAQS